MLCLDDRDSAGVLALQMVSQVLDEAFIIANAARESGQPWRYLSAMNFKSIATMDTSEDNEASLNDTNEDTLNENEAEKVSLIATSTPQKLPMVSDERKRPINEVINIGQGDEYIELPQSDQSQESSTMISHLFKISGVERVTSTDNTEVDIATDAETINPLTDDISKVMDSYVNSAFDAAFATDQEEEMGNVEGRVDVEGATADEYSDFVFLTDVFGKNFERQGSFYDTTEFVDDKHHDIFVNNAATSCTVIEETDSQEEDVTELRGIHPDPDTEQSFGNVDAYLTLNRDEQCSDDDTDEEEEAKPTIMHDVELPTAYAYAQTSQQEIVPCFESEQTKELAATSGLTTSSRKTFVHRCRIHGARLLACLRGWWRRRTPNSKRKEYRVFGPGECPPPAARRRASSMKGEKTLASPSESHSLWKFNTVNESLVNCTQWKDYTFETQPGSCGEFAEL